MKLITLLTTGIDVLRWFTVHCSQALWKSYLRRIKIESRPIRAHYYFTSLFWWILFLFHFVQHGSAFNNQWQFNFMTAVPYLIETSCFLTHDIFAFNLLEHRLHSIEWMNNEKWTLNMQPSHLECYRFQSFYFLCHPNDIMNISLKKIHSANCLLFTVNKCNCIKNILSSSFCASSKSLQFISYFYHSMNVLITWP